LTTTVQAIARAKSLGVYFLGELVPFKSRLVIFKRNAKFDQKIAKLLCRIFDFGGCYKEYMREKYCEADLNEFKVNLFPLPAPQIDKWSTEHIDLTETRIKYHYQTYCAQYRFKLLNALVNEFKPKVIVCFGRGYIEEFKLAFWGEGSPASLTEIEIKISELNIISVLSSNYATKLIIALFLGRNLTADRDLKEIAENIKNIILPDTVGFQSSTCL
tara:strand:+ start:3604 stop:4251 length:648 start_codon:yes stop_codon:yes gene_type:complete